MMVRNSAIILRARPSAVCPCCQHIIPTFFVVEASDTSHRVRTPRLAWWQRYVKALSCPNASTITTPGKAPASRNTGLDDPSPIGLGLEFCS